MSEETSVGERLLRSLEVQLAADQVAQEVEGQVAAALAGPVGTTMALLDARLPRAFIAVGAALTAAYTAVSAGDDVRAAGALLCAQELLFPADPLGRAAVVAAARPGMDGLPARGQGAQVRPGAEGAEQEVQRRVAADVDAMDRGYLRVASQLQAAALGAYSWKQLTGGMAVGADVMASPMGLFVDGLARWAYLVEVALEGVSRDDWVRVGAAVVAAKRVTSGS